MTTGNDNKRIALGMPIGTASNRLRKSILFSLICELKKNRCFQCSGEILSENDLSIEHKNPWLQADDPVKSFFDLGNIAFSHLNCNIAAGKRPHKRFTNEKERMKAKRKRWRARRTPEELSQKRRDWYERYGC